MCLMWSRCWDILSLLQTFLSFRHFMLCCVDGGTPTGCTWLVSSSSISSPLASDQAFPVHCPPLLSATYWPMVVQYISSAVCCFSFSLQEATGNSWPEGWAHLTIRKKSLGLFDSGRSTPLYGNHLSTPGRVEMGERLRLNSGQDH